MLICLSPLERPDPGLVAAACRAGALGVLDLGADRDVASRALRALAGAVREMGVRITDKLDAIELPAYVTTIITGDTVCVARAVATGRRVLAQVTSEAEARDAIAAGASGVIAKGCESGGRVGDETTFVLLQRLIATLDVPVWAQGGIGVHTAAACIAGGAAGVVLDIQLALVREATLPATIAGAISAMDGSETTIVDGRRVFDARGRNDHAAHGLPIGQDGALAKPLARAYGTVGQLVHSIERAITNHLELAADLQPLAPGAPLAVQHKLRYPIAQGPMSRVSDRARFAEAVARAGGLPFLALTLMTGAEVRELLTETRRLLGDLPWGVGILGFVPPEVREAQLEVLKELPPPVALIAGGRPSQANPLEAQGTATYLHVPSPGLLELFLKDGARKFVFEGSECGGHVGPRTSFALWEAQLDKLLAFVDAGGKAAELSVLFAGGIHDARSVAMVAAMAAPLAARGAKLGVLMGTAYLFTHEAVACGAIQPEFQEQALACDRTVLLETSPGHATRCADTAFATHFAHEKARLAADGVQIKEAWATLEQLNLGRLRVAAKGLVRDGDLLAAVDADTQRREGMYMIGQVAALRSSIVSVAELHHRASEGSREWLEVAAARETAGEHSGRGTDVAIVGIAAMFPGAGDTDTFWANIVANKNAIREVPPERWDVATYYDANAVTENAGRKTPCKWGGFLDDIPFDPLAYGIPPKSLGAIEPVQLLSLEIARRAIADSGYDVRPFDRARCSVIFGAEAGTDLSSAYNFRAMFPHYVGPLPSGLDDALPRLSEDSFPGVLANVIAGRIANRLDLGGVNYTVDAACAASLAAVDLSVKELVSGSSDMVLCGGADLHNGINDYLMFASVHALSPTGQCHTFDAKADGIVLGEGVACVVLKRLADAERDGDPIYAVVKGVAGASDGKSLGLTAPRKDGQVRALDRAYRVAGVSPAEVGLVEAHGTGTVVGDKTELATLVEVYARSGAGRGAAVLGSVKSQIGHTKCCAGMAGLIKTALAIHHGVLPPTSNLKTPSAAWDAETSPFVFLDKARPWPNDRRIAAVSAFGFGGTNFHAILASHRSVEAPMPARTWPAELILLRGEDRAAALDLAGKVERAATGGARLRDLARTLVSRGTGPVQLALVVESTADLKAKLAVARAGGTAPGVFSAAGAGAGKLAFLCSGQGSQKVGMFAELFVAFPRLHRWLALGRSWTPAVYPGQAFAKDAKDAQTATLTDTRVAQPALGIINMAVAELLRSLAIEPDMAGGHSYGELAALSLAGAIAETDLLPLSALRGEEILAAAGDDPGTMAAVSADARTVASVIAECDGVVIANHNSPKQCVLSGTKPAMAAALAKVKAAGLAAKPLQVACAFHSPVVAGAESALARHLAGLDITTPRIPVFSNVTGQAYGDDVRGPLAAQVASPVRWLDEVEAMYAAGARVFVETGPGQVLTRLVGDILGDRPHVAIACDDGGGGVVGILRAVAAIAVTGVAVDAAPLFWDRDAVPVDLDVTPAAARSGWLVNGHIAREVDASGRNRRAPTLPPPVGLVPIQRPSDVGLRPAMPGQLTSTSASSNQAVFPMSTHSNPRAIQSSSIPAATPDEPVVVGGESTTAVVEYLRNMRAMITAQRDVLLAYLGTAPAAVVARPMMMQSSAGQRFELGEVIDVAPLVPVAAVAPAPVAVAPVVAPAADTRIDPLQLVVAIVSERTGYPVETLGLDLDLEADLSIDSIKRIEIIGELAQRLGLGASGGADSDAIVEELAARKTLRALVGWLTERLAEAGAGGAATNGVAAATPTMQTAPTPDQPVAIVEPVAAAEPVEASAKLAIPDGPYGVRDAVTTRVQPITGAAPVQRFVVEVVPAPPPVNGHSSLAGVRVAIAVPMRDRDADVAALADDLAARLTGEGAIVGSNGMHAPGAIHVDIGPYDDVAALRGLFERVRDAALADAKRILVVTRAGQLGRGRPGAGGVAGLIKTVAAEFPAIVARAVDVPPETAAVAAAALVHAELHRDDGHVEVGYVDGVRSTLDLVSTAPALATHKLPIDASSLVLVTGGARGITARAAIALVRRTGCKVALVGRSRLPAPADATANGADPGGDARALRSHFAKQLPIAEVEAAVERTIADRDIRATLTALGDRASYHAVDVRTPAFVALIDELRARHGGITGIIHGAGVLDDKLIKQKSPDGFERIVATKLDPALAIAAAVRDDVRFVALFSSIVGAMGNRGQVDYAVAGDALDKLAWQLAARTRAKVVAIDWGPWGGGGMVSAELAREYARRGVALIDPDAGVAAFLAELAGPPGDPQVVLCASDPRAFARPRVAHRDHEAPRPTEVQ